MPAAGNRLMSAAIVAAIYKAEREITGHFMQMHAVAPGDAVAFVPGNRSVRNQLDRMLARGAIKQAGQGLYWLDIPAYNADRQRRRSRLVPIAILVAVIAALALTLGYRGGGLD
jgi:4-amino-4-deoxy-L-arabinose transferase-like glycosyltransferase